MGVGSRQQQCFVIDFGICKRFRSSHGVHPARQVAEFRGSTAYASVHSHLLMDLGRRDDLWSLFYVLVEFLDGELPWRHVQEKERVKEMKLYFFDHPEQMTKSVAFPEELSAFADHLQVLQYADKPDYAYLLNLLTAWNARCGGASPPQDAQGAADGPHSALPLPPPPPATANGHPHSASARHASHGSLPMPHPAASTPAAAALGNGVHGTPLTSPLASPALPPALLPCAPPPAIAAPLVAVGGSAVLPAPPLTLEGAAKEAAAGGGAGAAALVAGSPSMPAPPSAPPPPASALTASAPPTPTAPSATPSSPTPRSPTTSSPTAHSTGVLREDSTGVLREDSTGVLREHSTGVLREHSTGVLREHSTGVLREHSTGVLREHSTTSHPAAPAAASLAAAAASHAPDVVRAASAVPPLLPDPGTAPVGSSAGGGGVASPSVGPARKEWESELGEREMQGTEAGRQGSARGRMGEGVRATRGQGACDGGSEGGSGGSTTSSVSHSDSSGSSSISSSGGSSSSDGEARKEQRGARAGGRMGTVRRRDGHGCVAGGERGRGKSMGAQHTSQERGSRGNDSCDAPQRGRMREGGGGAERRQGDEGGGKAGQQLLARGGEGSERVRERGTAAAAAAVGAVAREGPCGRRVAGGGRGAQGNGNAPLTRRARCSSTSSGSSSSSSDSQSSDSSSTCSSSSGSDGSDGEASGEVRSDASGASSGEDDPSWGSRGRQRRRKGQRRDAGWGIVLRGQNTEGGGGGRRSRGTLRKVGKREAGGRAVGREGVSEGPHGAMLPVVLALAAAPVRAAVPRADSDVLLERAGERSGGQGRHGRGAAWEAGEGRGSMGQAQVEREGREGRGEEGRWADDEGACAEGKETGAVRQEVRELRVSVGGEEEGSRARRGRSGAVDVTTRGREERHAQGLGASSGGRATGDRGGEEGEAQQERMDEDRQRRKDGSEEWIRGGGTCVVVARQGRERALGGERDRDGEWAHREGRWQRERERKGRWRREVRETETSGKGGEWGREKEGSHSVEKERAAEEARGGEAKSEADNENAAVRVAYTTHTADAGARKTGSSKVEMVEEEKEKEERGQEPARKMDWECRQKDKREEREKEVEEKERDRM
ncbi:unnamed protein product, partial [Closterium sp. NIES-54]